MLNIHEICHAVPKMEVAGQWTTLVACVMI